ncbi:hypothetical protein G7Y89_g4569 [Cudoniella acicularis]|uniref:Uncharacterized protein n=1 Tax=Cudoniella acicularis TaxID=354080 RepID=A0A8H4RRC6_9HELO|nr:hypothetical protein G7Y89_g4569 [Cudoniella acicularis]
MAPINRAFTPAFRMMTQRRSLSLAQRARQAIRDFEPHPFERYPTTTKVAKADWGRQARRLGDAAMFYFPAYAILLGWPLLAEEVLDGRMGDL